jgi:hypothetical protein
MKFQDVPQRGSKGNTTASRNRFSDFHCERVSPVHPRTAAQHGVWENMADLSWLWNHLDEERWAGWRRLAPHVLSRPSTGNPAALDACQVFKNRKYHVPLPGSRIFIRVWQQINGWENESRQLIASYRVPLGKFSLPGEGSFC